MHSCARATREDPQDRVVVEQRDHRDHRQPVEEREVAARWPALRLPEVVAVRLTEDAVELVLAEPLTPAPTGWQVEGGVEGGAEGHIGITAPPRA